jgi:hypothetical protein
LSERVYLVVDGIDGRSITWSSRTRAGSRGVGQDMIVEVAPVVSCPRPADGNIAANAEENDGVTGRAGTWSASATALSDRAKDSEAFVRSHVRRLEALRRAGHVERIDADHWKIPYDIIERGQGYDLSSGWLRAQNEVAA